MTRILDSVCEKMLIRELRVELTAAVGLYFYTDSKSTIQRLLSTQLSNQHLFAYRILRVAVTCDIFDLLKWNCNVITKSCGCREKGENRTLSTDVFHVHLVSLWLQQISPKFTEAQRFVQARMCLDVDFEVVRIHPRYSTRPFLCS